MTDMHYCIAYSTLCYLLQAAELVLMGGAPAMVGVFGVKLGVKLGAL